MKKLIVVTLTACLILTGNIVTAAEQTGPVVTEKISATFDDVRGEVETAILNRGFVVDFNAAVGDMLNRTAADLEIKSNVYTHAETWQFCSASLSHKMVAADPVNLAYCPFAIFAYETTNSPGTIVVGFRQHASTGLPATTEALEEIDNELRGIINDVANAF